MYKIVSVLFLFVSSSVFGASNCPEFYAYEKPYRFKDVIELCNSFFVTIYKPLIKSPLFSSALVPNSDKKVLRTNNFRADLRLDPSIRAEVRDYDNTVGLDKGHLVAAADSDDPQQMSDTFLLSNIVPQNSNLNRGAWNTLEQRVRSSLKRPTIIVTGAVYKGTQKNPIPLIGKNQIPVPSGFYKIVYYDVPVIWYADNLENAAVKEISFLDLRRISGITFKQQ